MNTTFINELGMSTPAIYRVQVRGALDPDVAEQLNGVNITSHPAAGGEQESILVARLVDQAALSGLLNALYDLHLPLLSVECLNADE